MMRGFVFIFILSVFALLSCSESTLTAGFRSNDDDWDWSRTRTWLLYSSGPELTEAQARFAATHFDIIGPGGADETVPNSGEVTQAAAAAHLKRYNPNVIITIYRNTNLVIEGELHSDLEFQAHPEWMLRDAKGAVVWNTPSTVPGQPGTQPYINFTNDAAREWWVRGIVSAITEQPNGTAIDGVYADGAGTFEVIGRGLAPGQNALLNASHARAVGELTAAIHAIRPGMVVIGNGAVLAECGRSDDRPVDWNPCARNLPNLDGVCAEHFGSFGSVNATTGDFDTDGGVAQAHHGGNVNEKWQTALDIVKDYDGGSQLVLVKSWPGPFSMYRPNGTLEFTWKNLSDAGIKLTDTMRKTLGARALPWSLAAYLLSATPNTFMSYGWWYQLSTGYVPCPDEPASCSSPDDWYPDLLKPTGKPLGPRTHVPGKGSGHVWARQFERVSVEVDLANFTYPVSLVWS